MTVNSIIAGLNHGATVDKLDHFFVRHFTWLQEAVCRFGVIVQAHKIGASELVCVEFDEFAVEEGLFTQKIASLFKKNIIGTVMQSEQTVMKRGGIEVLHYTLFWIVIFVASKSSVALRIIGSSRID